MEEIQRPCAEVLDPESMATSAAEPETQGDYRELVEGSEGGLDTAMATVGTSFVLLSSLSLP